VADTGIGMAPDVLSRAGEEFFTTKALGEGTGLGLPISKRVVESVGGTLKIESTLGKGTTVRFWVPQSAAL
jgi:signal transduction histidine kinase